MDYESYNAAWGVISPLMLKRLEELSDVFGEHSVSMTEPRQSGDEEWSHSVELMRDGEVIASLDFTLHDGDVYGEEGFSTSLTWSAADGDLPAHRWAPYVYTPEAFSQDLAEIQRRIERELDPGIICATVMADLLVLAHRTEAPAATP